MQGATESRQARGEAHEADGLLYVARARATGARTPIPHAIFGRVFEPELTPLSPVAVAAGLGEGEVRVRALDQLVLALAG